MSGSEATLDGLRQVAAALVLRHVAQDQDHAPAVARCPWQHPVGDPPSSFIGVTTMSPARGRRDVHDAMGPIREPTSRVRGFDHPVASEQPPAPRASRSNIDLWEPGTTSRCTAVARRATPVPDVAEQTGVTSTSGTPRCGRRRCGRRAPRSGSRPSRSRRGRSAAAWLLTRLPRRRRPAASRWPAAGARASEDAAVRDDRPSRRHAGRGAPARGRIAKPFRKRLPSTPNPSGNSSGGVAT